MHLRVGTSNMGVRTCHISKHSLASWLYIVMVVWILELIFEDARIPVNEGFVAGGAHKGDNIAGASVPDLLLWRLVFQMYCTAEAWASCSASQ
ncbi:hypothetical protein AVEN_44393-1 [Araneus ventricosus]|uniref:Uncharacterized protein n=1 Tax=Araneus ventricosus TaxID=182803 RepID=A0A4Y2K4U2_ARAVE|nr:hypothetical protein AVEN_44393-1 [Araneus ventricosus]